MYHIFYIFLVISSSKQTNHSSPAALFVLLLEDLALLSILIVVPAWHSLSLTSPFPGIDDDCHLSPQAPPRLLSTETASSLIPCCPTFAPHHPLSSSPQQLGFSFSWREVLKGGSFAHPAPSLVEISPLWCAALSGAGCNQPLPLCLLWPNVAAGGQHQAKTVKQKSKQFVVPLPFPMGAGDSEEITPARDEKLWFLLLGARLHPKDTIIPCQKSSFLLDLTA